MKISEKVAFWHMAILLECYLCDLSLALVPTQRAALCPLRGKRKWGIQGKATSDGQIKGKQSGLFSHSARRERKKSK